MAHEPVTPEEIGARLVLLRKAMKWPTATAFAAHVEITPSALNNYERGRGRPDIDAALKIVRRTGVTLDWIYLGATAGLSVRLSQLLTEVEEQQQRAVLSMPTRPARRASE